MRKNPIIINNPDVSQIRRVALKSNKDWLVWRDRDGAEFAAKRSAYAVKRAMLDMGTSGHLLMYCARSITALRIGWRQALILRNNARIGY